jgi:hypothetical protein
MYRGSRGSSSTYVVGHTVFTSLRDKCRHRAWRLFQEARVHERVARKFPRDELFRLDMTVRLVDSARLCSWSCAHERP